MVARFPDARDRLDIVHRHGVVVDHCMPRVHEVTGEAPFGLEWRPSEPQNHRGIILFSSIGQTDQESDKGPRK
jgi:hypothetical protein